MDHSVFLERIKEIPITDVLNDMYGIEVRKKGDRGYCKIRNERTASCVVYPNNRWYDFGMSEGGDVIDLVQTIEHCDTATALNKLGANYGIEREKAVKERGFLSPREWRSIGIEPDMTSKNLNIFVTEGSEKPPRYSDVVLYTSNPQQMENFKQKYHCPIAEFKKRDPETFAKILKKRSLSPLLSDRDLYFAHLLSTFKLINQINNDPEISQKHIAADPNFIAEATELNRRARTLKTAALDINGFKFWWQDLNPAKDMAAILSGQTRVTISEKSYYELCFEAKKAGEGTLSFEVPYDSYVNQSVNYPLAFERLSHCATYRGGICTVTVLEKDASAVKNLFADDGIKPAALSTEEQREKPSQKTDRDTPPKR